jgi:hypothetical protein
LLLIDPSWQANTPAENLPADAIAGGWMLADDGTTTGPFEPNPDYVPRDPTTPTDPLDTVLRMIADGAELGERIIPTLRDAVVHIGCDEQNQPLIGPAPDGVSCVPVATAEVHKRRVAADRWFPVAGSKLAEIVPHGVDILINPGGPAQFRLATETLRHAQ